MSDDRLTKEKEKDCNCGIGYNFRKRFDKTDVLAAKNLLKEEIRKKLYIKYDSVVHLFNIIDEVFQIGNE